MTRWQTLLLVALICPVIQGDKKKRCVASLQKATQEDIKEVPHQSSKVE